jgi:hypothetical protein
LIHLRNPLASIVRAAGAQSPYARLTGGCSPAQLPYVLDSQPICANHAARRSGKSDGTGRRLLRRAHLYPGGLSFFAAKTAGTAKRILWTTLRELNHKWQLGMVPDTGTLTWTAPNGYQVWLLGLKDHNEADKLRGAAHGFVDGAIDEAASIQNEVLKYAVLECALPALGENGGRLSISGTPGPVMSGFFYDQCVARNAYHWDARQNPHLRVPGQRYLENALKQHAAEGWTWDHPTFKREYLGLWCEDRTALVYDYHAGRNLIYPGSEFPSGRTILGVDIGWDDGCGYTVSRSQPPNNPDVHVLCSYERREQKLPAIAAEIEKLRRRYSCNYIFIDEGGIGKTVAETLRGMGIPCRSTPKGPKRPRIEVLRGGISAGTIKLVRGQCETLEGEMGIIIWNEDRTDIDERYSNECTDSCIYSILSHRGFYEYLLEEPEIGSAEHTNKQQQSDKEREEAESITAADVAKVEQHLQRARGVAKDLTTPRKANLR